MQDEQSGFNYNERTNPRRRRLSFIISLFQSVACRQARASQYGSRCAAIRVLRTLLRRRKNRSRRSRLAVYTAVAQDPLDTSERKVDNLLRRATESNPWLHDSSGPALPRRCRITRSERERALLLCGTQRGGCPCGVGVRTSPETLENNASDKQNVKFSALFRVTGRRS